MEDLGLQSRDIIILIVYFITLISLFSVHRHIVKNLNNVVFEKRGGLNLVSNRVCYERRKSIHEIIDREAGINAVLSDKIDNLSDNLHMIMGAQGLEPKKYIKKDHKKIFYQCSK